MRQFLVAIIALHLIYHLDLPCEEILILQLVVLEESRVALFLLLELLLFYNVQQGLSLVGLTVLLNGGLLIIVCGCWCMMVQKVLPIQKAFVIIDHSQIETSGYLGCMGQLIRGSMYIVLARLQHLPQVNILYLI